MNSKVSIITPSYNSSKTITESVNSILNQSYKNWELIIIDDHSTDNSPEIIKNYEKRDARINTIFLEENSGPALARNAGIEKATGDYIAFLDSDDIWMPNKLKSQLQFIQDNNLKLTYSSYYVIDNKGEVNAKYKAPKKLTYQKLLKSNFIGNLTGIYSVQYFGKQYFPDQKHEDYVLWLRLLKQLSHTLGQQKFLAKYRKWDQGVSSNKLETIMWQWNIYRNIENLSIYESIVYMLWYIYYGLTKYKN